MILNLGVNDVPYQNPPPKRQRKIRAGTVTTGDVAGFLERKYGVMQAFVDKHEAEIIGDLEHSIEGSLATIFARAAHADVSGEEILRIEPFAQGLSQIEDRFKQFIATGEIETMGIPGVPTQAALDRAAGKKRSARFKRRRPSTGKSFIDSGLFVANFRAWMTP